MDEPDASVTYLVIDTASHDTRSHAARARSWTSTDRPDRSRNRLYRPHELITVQELVSASLAEVATALGAGVVSVVVSIVGVLTERAGLQNVAAGHTTVGVWEIGVGLLVLFLGVYLLGYQQCWQRLSTLGETA